MKGGTPRDRCCQDTTCFHRGGFGSDGTLVGQADPTTYNEGQPSTTGKCYNLAA